jgi:hypothetical protein
MPRLAFHAAEIALNTHQVVFGVNLQTCKTFAAQQITRLKWRLAGA